MFPESTRGATWTNLNNAGIRDQGPANGMYAAEQANLPIPLESHFLWNTGRYRLKNFSRDRIPEELLQGQAPQHQQQPAINPAIGQLNYSVEWGEYFSQIGNEVNDRQESGILQWQLSPEEFLVDHGTGQWKDSGPASYVHEQCDRMESESSDVEIDIKPLLPLDLSSDDKMSSVEYVTSDREMFNPDSEGEEDGYAISVAGPAASQLDSAFQPYSGRLKGLQGLWIKVKERGSWKEETGEKGKDHQKKQIGRKKEKSEEERPDRHNRKNGRKKISKNKHGKVWKNRKKGKTKKRKTSSMSKKRHKNLRESPEMIKVASGILVDMFEENNAGSIADALLGPSQVKILTMLCRKARTGETAYRATHSPSPGFGFGLRRTERKAHEEHVDSGDSKFSTVTAGEFRSCGKEELQMQDEAVHLSRQSQVHIDSMLCTQSCCLNLPCNASHKPSMRVDSAHRIVK